MVELLKRDIPRFGVHLPRDALQPVWHDFERQFDRPGRERQAGRNGGGRQQLVTLCLTHCPCWRHPQSSWGPQRGPSSPLAIASQLAWKRSAGAAQIFSRSRSRQAATNQSKCAALCLHRVVFRSLSSITHKMQVSFQKSKRSRLGVDISLF